MCVDAHALMWHNHLRVGFSSEGSGLEEWLLVPYASAINIKSGMNIIDSINDEVKEDLNGVSAWSPNRSPALVEHSL